MAGDRTLSIVMTNYNHARFLPESLSAILEQSYQPCEVLVVDDGSTDNSVEIIEGFASRYPRLRLTRNDRNRGVWFSIARLLDLARGTHISFQSADDRVLPGFFEKAMHLFDRFPHAAFCSGVSLIIDEHGSVLGTTPGPGAFSGPVFLAPKDFLATIDSHGCWSSGNATIVNRSYLHEAGGFRSELESFCDGFLYVVCGLRHGACFIPEPVAAWRRVEGSYASLKNADLDLFLKVIDRVTHLMNTEYRDLFPPRFTTRFTDRLLFGTAVTFLAASQKRQLWEIEKLLPPRARWHAAFLSSIRLLMKVQLALMRGGLFLRFRPRDWRTVIVRRLRALLP